MTMAFVPGSASQGAPNIDYFGGSLRAPTMDLDAEAVLAMLDAPGKSPYTPELTAETLAMIKRRGAENTGNAVAATQSDIMARGGTGSSTEYLALNNARNLGNQTEEDQVLNFMLGTADRAAEDRRFRTGTGLDIYKTGVGQMDSFLNRQFQYGLNEDSQAHEQMLTEKYMAQLAAQQAAERRRRRKGGIASAVGSIGGAVIGGIYGGPVGASVGSQAGQNLGFLFA